ncbi:MAG: hypothetical protein ACNA8W_17635, partial [Bradymonadaceae bacterium]
MIRLKWMGLLLIASLSVVACSGNDDRRGGEREDIGDPPDTGFEDVAVPDAELDGDGPPPRPMDGPGAVLDAEAAQNPAGLSLVVRTAESGPQPVSSVGSEVYRIDFTFRSQTAWGSEWNHSAVVFIPLEISATAPEGAFVIIPPGTPNEVRGVSEGPAYRNNYAARFTAIFGIPSMVLPGLPGPVNLQQGPSAWQGEGPAECFGASLAPSRYASCLLTILSNTDDIEADPFRPLANGWMRAITAAEEVARQAPTTTWRDDGPVSFSLSRALILADEERAVGARMAAAVDDRIDGVFGVADFGALSSYVATMQSAWRSDYGWFSNPGAFSTWLDTPAGARWRDTVDPSNWPHMIAEKHFVNVGATNHPRFPLNSANEFMAAFPETSNRLMVHDHGAGFGTQEHLTAWYAFVTRVYLNRPWLRVSVTSEPSGSNFDITATATGEASAQGARLAGVQQHRS